MSHSSFYLFPASSTTSYRAAAHIALLRLPLNLSSQTLAQSLLKLIAASSYGNYPLVYKSAEELLDLAKDNSINASLANIIKLMVDRYLGKSEILFNL